MGAGRGIQSYTGGFIVTAFIMIIETTTVILYIICRIENQNNVVTVMEIINTIFLCPPTKLT